MDNKVLNVRAILAGEAPKDTAVTVKGWVRTRRDSKAGISFVHLSDGSAFHPRAGGGAEHAAQLRRRGPEADRRLRGGGDGHDRAVAGEGPAVRDAGERGARDRLGGRPRHLSDPAQAAHHGVPARGGAPAAAHQRDRRGDARAPHAGAGDPPLLSRERLLLGQHADHHGAPTRKARARCSGCRRSISPTCRATPRARSTSRRISSAASRS